MRLYQFPISKYNYSKVKESTMQNRFNVNVRENKTSNLLYRLTQNRLQFFRDSFPEVAEIYFMVLTVLF